MRPPCHHVRWGQWGRNAEEEREFSKRRENNPVPAHICRNKTTMKSSVIQSLAICLLSGMKTPRCVETEGPVRVECSWLHCAQHSVLSNTRTIDADRLEIFSVLFILSFIHVLCMNNLCSCSHCAWCCVSSGGVAVRRFFSFFVRDQECVRRAGHIHLITANTLMDAQ